MKGQDNARSQEGCGGGNEGPLGSFVIGGVLKLGVGPGSLIAE